MRHDDRRVVVCQLRREDEGVTAFGLTGEGDEDGGEHPFTVGPAVAAAIRERDADATVAKPQPSRVPATDGAGGAAAGRCRHVARHATDNPRVVIAGGGVAALEACLALRDRLSAADLDITLLTPAERFDYRPLSVLRALPRASRAGASPWRRSRPTRTSPSSTTR